MHDIGLILFWQRARKSFPIIFTTLLKRLFKNTTGQVLLKRYYLNRNKLFSEYTIYSYKRFEGKISNFRNLQNLIQTKISCFEVLQSKGMRKYFSRNLRENHVWENQSAQRSASVTMHLKIIFIILHLFCFYELLKNW